MSLTFTLTINVMSFLMIVDVEMVPIRIQHSLLFCGHPVTITLYFQTVTASSHKSQIRLIKYLTFLKLSTSHAVAQFTIFIRTSALICDNLPLCLYSCKSFFACSTFGCLKLPIFLTVKKGTLSVPSNFMYHQLQHSEILCSAHNAFMCVAWISEQTAIISLYSINLSVFKTEAESVYCALRNGSLNQADTVSYLKG